MGKKCKKTKERYVKFANRQLKHYRRMKDQCQYPINKTKANKDAATFNKFRSVSICNGLTKLTSGVERWSANYNKSCKNPNKNTAAPTDDWPTNCHLPHHADENL